MRFHLQSLLLFCLLSVFFSSVSCDIYLQNPRGANNRLNEPTAQRQNGNRLCDTQNNNRGGYNVGEKTTSQGGDLNSPGLIYNLYDFSSAIQYPMLYFENSIITLEWTVQHGCGGNEANDPHQQNCQMILQYLCETNDPSNAYFNPGSTKYVHTQRIQDGATVTNNDQGEPRQLQANFNLPAAGSPNPTNLPAENQNGDNGRHESELYYFYCTQRQRNSGLFTADQNLQGATAQFTRQNAGGGRSGLECSEERDYYPYWSPSPWKDIAILTDHPEMCPYYQQNSQNVKTVYQCEYQPNQPAGGTITNTNSQNAGSKNPLYQIDARSCAQANPVGVWQAYFNNVTKNGMPAPPDCQQSEWTRTNHHGNGRHGLAQRYVWTLPTISDLKASNVKTDSSATNPQAASQTVEMAACVFRIRYNISTDDYDPWNINSTYNNNPQAGIYSPVTNNPTVDVGGPVGLQLAVNTAQYGRTFQDRSHKFYIAARPSQFQGVNIYNLNIRGKRGDIVQVYPAVEYDFIPNNLTISGNDIVHIQWTGSDTANNNGGGGDGQAGDAGQGQDGTDRNNMVLSLAPQDNYPFPLDKFPTNLWSLSTCYDMYGNTISSPAKANSWVDCAVIMATSGYFRSAAAVNNTFNPLLNNAPPSLVGGVLLQVQPNVMFSASPTPFYYFCSRNNQFTNRSQKGVLYYTS